MAGLGKKSEVIASKLSAFKQGKFKEFIKYLQKYLHYLYFALFKSGNEFVVDGKPYKYFYHMYNSTWTCERPLEIPIVLGYIEANKGREILEIGNVMKHYFDLKHDVIDKYEKYPGVINEDIVDYKTSRKYNLIFTISTFEHVGYDEDVKDPNKILTALDCTKKLLKPGGKAVVTLPIGHNKPMDEMLFNGKIKFDKTICLSRVSYDKWKQVNGLKEIQNASFCQPYPQANALVVGILEN